ncbi:hypothetical protein ACI1US_02356 [Leucobacter sp. BZR 635]
MIEPSYGTFSSSRADDQAFLALRDAAQVTADLPDTRVVGGMMVSLLTEAFPAQGFVVRRTADVDAALSVHIAQAGAVHERLCEVGYTASSGNSYRKGDQVVDLLVPSRTGHFSSEEHGGRGFDAVPGLSLAIAGHPVTHHVDVLLSDYTSFRITVRTPSVEHAVVLKALAVTGRSQAKDLIDLYNLLLIAEQHPHEEIGGWRLHEVHTRGARFDASRQLARLLTLPGLRAAVEGSGVPVPALTQLIRALATPESRGDTAH